MGRTVTKSFEITVKQLNQLIIFFHTFLSFIIVTLVLSILEQGLHIIFVFVYPISYSECSHTL